MMDFITIASGVLVVFLALSCFLTCLLTSIQCGCCGFFVNVCRKAGWGCWLMVQMFIVIGVFTFFIICIEDALIKM